MTSLAKIPFSLAVAAVFLAGCASPSPRMMSAERHESVIAGSKFTVFRQGDQVEVYRTSLEVLPRTSEVFAKAEVAIRQATGCGVKEGSFAGDPALMTALLDCG